ncbi:hypothetical protein BCR36DRAFT_283214, partial [Piromyces finnis]
TISQDSKDFRQKQKPLKTNNENMRNLININGRNLSDNYSSSIQQSSKFNKKNSLNDIREPNNYHLKTKNENQAFQKFYNSNSSTKNILNSSSTTSKVKKTLISPHNYSTPILPQTRPYNTSNCSGNKSYSSFSRQNSDFSNSMNGISNITSTPNFLKKSNSISSGNGFHHINHNNSYLSAEPTRANYYSTNDIDIDVNYQDNKRKQNYNGKTFHENVYSNITRKKDNSYMKTRYSKYIKAINIITNVLN